MVFDYLYHYLYFSIIEFSTVSLVISGRFYLSKISLPGDHLSPGNLFTFSAQMHPEKSGCPRRSCGSKKWLSKRLKSIEDSHFLKLWLTSISFKWLQLFLVNFEWLQLFLINFEWLRLFLIEFEWLPLIWLNCTLTSSTYHQSSPR